jgi:hypothetical protein
MDLASAANLIALLLSITALAVSVVFARRQANISHGSNFLNLLSSSFANLRSPEFISSQQYVARNMDQHDPSLGYSGLPEEVRIKILTVSHFYNDLGRLIVHKGIDESIALSSFGEGLFNSWTILQPFIESERIQSPTRFMLYFEHLATLIRDQGGPLTVGREFQLRSW